MGQPGEAQGNDGYYELRKTDGKGNGAFALKDISPGTRILVDNALFIIDKNLNHIGIHDVQQALRGLSNANQEKFHALPVPDYAQGHSDEHRRLAIFHLHNHTIRGGSAHGCFIHASRFNNSCSPNCAMASNDKGQKHCYVFKDVRAGQELNFAYTDSLLYMTTHERYEHLRDCLGGPCLCTLCITPAPQREASDLRRRLMRYLLFISKGHELPDELRAIVSRDFHTKCIPWKTMTDKCIFWPMLLFAHLAEAEGIISGVSFRYNYVDLIAIVLGWCIDNKVKRLSVQMEDYLRLWARKARQAKRLTTGEDIDSGVSKEQEFANICKMVDDIDARGFLPRIGP